MVEVYDSGVDTEGLDPRIESAKGLAASRSSAFAACRFSGNVALEPECQRHLL